MRKSLWIIPVLLLFAISLAPAACADTVIFSGFVVTAINGIAVGGTTYNVTFGHTDDTTFATNPANADTMLTAIQADLNNSIAPAPPCSGPPFIGTGSSSSTGSGETLAVDGGPTFHYIFRVVTITPYPPSCSIHWGLGTISNSGFSTLIALYSKATYWAEFSPVAAPEPGTISLMLIGLGSLGLVLLMRKRAALRHPQAT